MGRRKSDAFDAATLLLAPSLQAQYIHTEGKEKQNMFNNQPMNVPLILLILMPAHNPLFRVTVPK